MRTKAIVAIVIAAALWASAGTVAKLLFRETTPFVAAFYRFAIASAIMLPFFVRSKPTVQSIKKLLPLGIFNAMNILFYYSGISLTSANTAIILGAAVPLTTAILSPILIKESVSKEKFAGVAVGLIGALLIVFLPVLRGERELSGNLFGNVLLVCSLLSWTGYILYSRAALGKGTYPPALSTSVNLFTCTVAAGLAGLISGQQFFFPALVTPSYIGLLIFAALGITVVTFFLFQWAVQHVSASTASLKEYLQLMIGLMINAVVLGERLTLMDGIGSILIVSGVVIATGESMTRKLSGLLFSKEE